jgi:hypothetical protein
MNATTTAQDQCNAPRPEFIRFPRQGTVEPHTGLARAFLYQLAKQGKIRTISLRDRNKTRGVRLIVFDSLIEFIRRAGALP